MDIDHFQREAVKHSTVDLHQGPQAMIKPLLGLTAQIGSIANVYKRFLRDGIDLANSRRFLSQELGDLLWYAAAIAEACDLDLGQVAEQNLVRVGDRYGSSAGADLFSSSQLALDVDYPITERFPRRLVFQFFQHGYRVSGGGPAARMRIVDVDPNPFPSGPIIVDGKPHGFAVGTYLGASISDNTHTADGYRYHDAIHLGYLACLGWSPNMRALLQIKRRSRPIIDENEDGGRAILTEEALTVALAELAKSRMGFVDEVTVDGDVLELVRACVRPLEVGKTPVARWRKAIVVGFRAMKSLLDNEGGYLVADLDAQSLSYSKLAVY
jgi:hypothetical protein